MSITQQTTINTIQVEEPTDKYTLNVTLNTKELQVLRVFVGRVNTMLFNNLFGELSGFCDDHFSHHEMDKVREALYSNLGSENKVINLLGLN